MASLLIILKFLGSLIFLFVLGWLVGHLIKFDKYLKY